MIETFWHWVFVQKPGRKTGYRLLVQPWLIVDCAVGILLTTCLKIDGFQFASKALFPATSILISMAVAWTARATIIVGDKDFRKNFVGDDNPIEDYLYGYQLSMLILFATVIYVALMASGGFDFYVFSKGFSKTSSSFFLYFLLSLTLRECWSVVNFTNLLSLLNSRAK